MKNRTLINFARNEIKWKLKKLPEDSQMVFKRMYSHDNLKRPIDDVVDLISEDKLDWALTQVENTIK